jgi:hypothetical protein
VVEEHVAVGVGSTAWWPGPCTEPWPASTSVPPPAVRAVPFRSTYGPVTEVDRPTITRYVLLAPRQQKSNEVNR